MIAKNGAALIAGNIVPATEMLVLKTLVGLGRPATVPEIALAMDEQLSDASLYSLLGRLKEKRGLVDREEVVLEVSGRPLRRIKWQPHQEAANFIKELQHDADDKNSTPGRVAMS